jgi:tRNA (guanine37-N1)-methyltransferase
MARLSFHFLTLFPDAFKDVLASSLLGKAQAKGAVSFHLTQIRDFSEDKHRTVDDAPYGGGEGMLIRADVLTAAFESVKTKIDPSRRVRTILMSPQGPLLTQTKAKTLAENYDDLIVVCGHYEGVDERFIELCVDEELSIGDYVLTGGELPAMVLADTVTRLLPEVVGNEDSVTRDSLEGGLLKYPQYTKPRDFRGAMVPEVLLSGDHGKIQKWRVEQALNRTKTKRPDLFQMLKKVLPVFVVLTFGVGCKTTPTRSKIQPKEVKAITAFEEDEMRAPRIQKELNAIFFSMADKNPEGYAFDPIRLTELEQQLEKSKNPDIAYFQDNRGYFSMTPDSGGGFMIRPNRKRIGAIAKTPEGRNKIFELEATQLREAIANPCLDEFEDCGDLASDANANPGLIRRFFRKFPDPQFSSARAHVVTEYIKVLEAYRDRKDWSRANQKGVAQSVQKMLKQLSQLKKKQK